MPWSPTTGCEHFLASIVDVHVGFRIYNAVALPNASLSGLIPFNLAAYGLSACCLTLKPACCQTASKDSLSGGWPALPERDSHPLDFTTLPGRTVDLIIIKRRQGWKPKGTSNT